MESKINGFKIIQDLGLISYKKSKAHFVIAICKVCAREWKVVKSSLLNNNSCGCKRAVQIKPLPEIINGFKIIEDLGSIKGQRKAKVECKECKNVFITHPWQLVHRKHCGCMSRGTKISKYVHTQKRLLKILVMMKYRCFNKTNHDYKYYGGRGIKVCDEWSKNGDSFVEWSLANGYEAHLTIERIDGTLDYCPENCRWATRLEQSRNRNHVVMNLELANLIRNDNSGLTQLGLSLKYKVSKGTISNILLNKTWKE